MPDPITRLNAALEGRYRIERELGEGGMATVYLADDLKHERKVALKVLKPELAAVVGAERFLAEIKTTANLQHPHILPLHDSGEADGFLYYVMPYIEGETLRDRLERERQLPVDEAVRIASDVAEALHSAHKHGVIHRDIKPANILLSEGRPLVADFGIALAVSAAGGGRLTETGLSLGTPYYMSPEQASADREPAAQSDVYSLGCVLFEMLVGEPPFTGGSAQAVLAKILMGVAPTPAEGRPTIPLNVDAVVRRSLERLPADRFATAQEFAKALGEDAFRHGTAQVGPVAGARAPRSVVPMTMAAAGLLLVFGWWLGRVSLSPEPESDQVVRFTLPVPGGYESTTSEEIPSIAIHPDGRSIVYREGGILMRRFLDQDEAEPISGTEDASSPVFSPDGTWLAFLQDDNLKRMSSEGVVTSIGTSSIDWIHGADWSEDGVIVYGRSSLGIWRISVDDGQPVAITDPSVESGERGHMWPQSLDGGSRLLYTVIGPSGKWHDAKIVVQDLTTGDRTLVVNAGAHGRYLPNGHLVYATEDGILQARRFDPASGAVGPSIPIESGVLLGQWGGGAIFAVSPSGTLVFARGDGSRRHLLEWYDRQGNSLGTWGPPRTVAWGLELDPTGRRLAASLPNSRNDDIHVLEENLQTPARLTSDVSSDGWPVWSPDGRRIAWQRDSDGRPVVLVREVETDEEPSTVYRGAGGVWPRSWSPDGRWIAISERRDFGQDIIAIDLEDAGNVVTVMDEQAMEWDPQFSPDGRYIAFDSNEAGPLDTYVVSFPRSGDPVRISSGRSQHPRWSPTRTELYFWSDSTLMAARYRSEPTFAVEDVRELFTVPDYVMTEDPHYTIAPDGERFLIQVHNPDAVVRELHVVLNWTSLVEDRVGGN